MTIQDRIVALRKVMQSKKLDAILITSIPNIHYLTEFSGSSATLIATGDAIHFFTDGRYAIQVEEELAPLKGLRIHIQRGVWEYIAQEQLLAGCSTIGFEAHVLSYQEAVKIRTLVRPAKLRATTGVIERITQVKTQEEIACIEEAVKITDAVFSHILPLIKPGIKETDLAAEISYQGRLRGAEADAFDMIVASGARSALPHGRASEKALEPGDMITFDFGFRYRGLHSDMTRTVMLGKPTDEQNEVYHLVLEAAMAAEAAVRANMKAFDLDAVARNIIKAKGYGEAFNHSLGHGLGREVHEAPGISFRSGDTRLLEGSVITIEPGVYLPNKFGVRIENDVVVEKEGCRILNKSPRELLIL